MRGAASILILTGTCAGFAMQGCSGSDEFDCEAVAFELLKKCDRTFSRTDPTLCSFAWSPSENIQRLEVLTAELCAIAMPSGDEDCYLESSCEDIAEGRCLQNVSPDEPVPEAECLERCDILALMCQPKCPGQGSGMACELCMTDCEQARVDCILACPLAR